MLRHFVAPIPKLRAFPAGNISIGYARPPQKSGPGHYDCQKKAVYFFSAFSMVPTVPIETSTKGQQWT